MRIPNARLTVCVIVKLPWFLTYRKPSESQHSTEEVVLIVDGMNPEPSKVLRGLVSRNEPGQSQLLISKKGDQ